MKKKILVVDDDSQITSSIRNSLTKFSSRYEVIGANSGTKCFVMLDEQLNPDLILLDVSMPDIDGIDVFKKLKENPLWKNIPMVFLVDDNDGFNEFFVDTILNQEYIIKPFDQDVFVSWIKNRFTNTGG